jgi:hypothetical protein
MEPQALGVDIMDQSWVEMALFTRPQRSLGHLGMISLNCGACANVRLEVAEMTTKVTIAIGNKLGNLGIAVLVSENRHSHGQHKHAETGRTTGGSFASAMREPAETTRCHLHGAKQMKKCGAILISEFHDGKQSFF